MRDLVTVFFWLMVLGCFFDTVMADNVLSLVLRLSFSFYPFVEGALKVVDDDDYSNRPATDHPFYFSTQFVLVLVSCAFLFAKMHGLNTDYFNFTNFVAVFLGSAFFYWLGKRNRSKKSFYGLVIGLLVGNLF